jgi:hypothetical protein
MFVYAVFLIGVLMLAGAGVAVVLLWPVRVVELSLDPPDDAHYTKFTDDELRQRALDIQLFWIAWTKTEGKLAERQLWAAVEEWNNQYKRYPEHSNWIIGRDAMRDVIIRYYRGHIPVPLRINSRVEWFVIVKDGKSKSLMPLPDLLGATPNTPDDDDLITLDNENNVRDNENNVRETPYLNGSTSGLVPA